jgi:hypothetical protein
MPDAKAVIWFNDPKEIASKIKSALTDSSENVSHARDWFRIINKEAPTQASARILDGIKTILECT